MKPSESILGELARAAVEGEHERIWEVVHRIDNPESSVEVEARLYVPTPIPAGWAAYALSDFDRSFRWAVRSAESGMSIQELRTSGRRPAATYRGINLVGVEEGSWISRLDPSGPLQKVFERKTWVVVGGVMTAVSLAGWAVTEVEAVLFPGHDVPQIVYVHEPFEIAPIQVPQPGTESIQTPPPPPIVNVRVTGQIRGTVTVRVGTATVTFTASPGSQWIPDEARRSRGR